MFTGLALGLTARADRPGSLGSTARSAAGFHPVHELAELDARLVLACQFGGQVRQSGSRFSEKIENDRLAVQKLLGIHQLDRDAQFSQELPARLERPLLPLTKCPLQQGVFWGELPEHLPANG